MRTDEWIPKNLPIGEEPEQASVSNSSKLGDSRPPKNKIYQSPQLSLLQVIWEFTRSPGGWITLSVFVATALRLTLGPMTLIDAILFLVVLLLWPVLEWFFHRFLLHEWTILPFHFTHDRHHETPTPATGLPDAWLISFYFVESFLLWAFNFPLLSSINVGVLTMLAIYEFVHFSCHSNYKPHTTWGWAVRVNHLQHHRFDESRFYSLLFPINRQ